MFILDISIIHTRDTFQKFFFFKQNQNQFSS